jgi:hypothetical protein
MLVGVISVQAQEELTVDAHVQAMEALVEKASFDPAALLPHIEGVQRGEELDAEHARKIDAVLGAFIFGYTEQHTIAPDKLMEHALFLRCCGFLRRLGSVLDAQELTAATAYARFLLAFAFDNIDGYSSLTEPSLAMVREIIRFSSERDFTADEVAMKEMAMKEVAWEKYSGNDLARVLASAYACRKNQAAIAYLQGELNGFIEICRPLNQQRIELYQSAFKSEEPLLKEEKKKIEAEYRAKCLELRKALMPVQIFLDACYPASLALLPEHIAEVKTFATGLSGLIPDKIHIKLTTDK